MSQIPHQAVAELFAKPESVFSPHADHFSISKDRPFFASHFDLDTAALALLFISILGYVVKLYWTHKAASSSMINEEVDLKADNGRSVAQKLAGLDCIVFYGSQTGTAEHYATRLAKEASSRFGIRTSVESLEDYDYDDLDQVPRGKTLMFVLATAGDGEATDNAQGFRDFITSDDVVFSQKQGASSLENLRYVAFGLGDSKYGNYNKMVSDIAGAFDKVGAKRIGQLGKGNDQHGTTEEDFLAWMEPMWAALAVETGLEEKTASYEPSFNVKERSIDPADDTVFLGEPNGSHLKGSVVGPFGASNPYIACVSQSKEISKDVSRKCLHIEIDIAGSGLTYSTGDHVAIWPSNPTAEVERFLSTFGVLAKRHQVVDVIHAAQKSQFPTRTTYDALARYYLEICGPISRHFITTLAEFSPNSTTKSEIERIGKDKEVFRQEVASQKYNIAQFLEQHFDHDWSRVPLSLLLESLPSMQPRYYSISSSGVAQPDSISITAAVESVKIENSLRMLKGVTTNYLLALKHGQHSTHNAPNADYELHGPRNKYAHNRVAIHLRSSKFRLPSDTTKPIIMVGPGTGVAPFRAFIQERAHQYGLGATVGKILLFFGCRDANDFLYSEEWEKYKGLLGDKFEIVTAFSRVGATKVYVQHRLQEKAAEVDRLLLQDGAYLYVCGDAANMARGVHEEIINIVSSRRGLDRRHAEDVVLSLRSANRYQEDVW